MGVAELVAGHDPWAERSVGVERLAHRHRRRAQLPVADGDVVGDRVAGDHLVGAVLRHVAAAGPDHDRKLALVVEQVRDARHVHVVVGTDHARDLLVEEHRELRRLHAGLGDVIGVVEADRQELARQHGSEQPDLLKRMALLRVVPIDDVAVLDRPRGAGPSLRRSDRAS